MNWCKFVADELHKELSHGKFSQACLFHMQVYIFLVLNIFHEYMLYFITSFKKKSFQLSYVDSLDVSWLGLVLHSGEFTVNRWSKKLIDTALFADIHNDGKSFGKLTVFY
jgi:hypothetical protein